MASNIETKINRISAAKEAISAAIAGKGVTVPDGTLIDGMAALIESIEAGGGGVSGITYGIYIPSVTGSLNKIEHGLGVVPKLFAICAGGRSIDSSGRLLDCAHGFSDRNLLFRMSRASASQAPSGYIYELANITQSLFAKSTAIGNATDESIVIGGGHYLTAGVEYYWFAVA